MVLFGEILPPGCSSLSERIITCPGQEEAPPPPFTPPLLLQTQKGVEEEGETSSPAKKTLHLLPDEEHVGEHHGRILALKLTTFLKGQFFMIDERVRRRAIPRSRRQGGPRSMDTRRG